MQEKFGASPEHESIDEILESIKGLVYPAVIDLNRPIRDHLNEEGGAAPTQDIPPIHSSQSSGGDTSAVQALSSFMHTVREKKEDTSLREKEHALEHGEAKKEPLKNTSLEGFLTDVVHNALTPHIRTVLEREMQTFLQNEGKHCMEALVSQWFELQGKDIVRQWLEKHAPALVVRCVEVYLQKLSQAAH